MHRNDRKAAVLLENGVIQIQNRPHVVPEAGEVEVGISRAGICSSDIERGFGDGAYHYPLVMGHEIAGIVTSAPHKANTFVEGDRVAIFPLLPCFKCILCKQKKYALCKVYSYYGSRRDGGFASHLNCREWNLIKLPDNVSFDDAALIEPTAVVIHAIKKLKLHQSDKQVCIIGAGFLGLLAVMCIRHYFPKIEISIVDRNDYKLKIGQKLGAKGIHLKDHDDWAHFVASNKNSYPKMIEFVGAPETFHHSISLCSQAGRIVWVGNITDDLLLRKEVVSSILRKELSILGSWNSQYKGATFCDWQETIKLTSDGVCPSNLVTTRITVDGIHETISRMFRHKLREREFVTTKVIVELD
jgi:L-iditol 2-dehydrogenase